MGLPVLLIVGVIAVAGIALLLNRSGCGERAPLDAELARQVFCADHPDVTPETVLVSRDETAAVLTLQGRDDIGLIQVVGDRYVTRMAGPGFLTAVRDTGSGRLVLAFADVTWPGMSLVFESDQHAVEWAQHLSRLVASSPVARPVLKAGEA